MLQCQKKKLIKQNGQGKRIFCLYCEVVIIFNPIECWVCGNDMNYIYDKEIEEMGYYRFDCTKCDESVLCPKKAPFLEKECEE